jgi:hypothetical protein
MRALSLTLWGALGIAALSFTSCSKDAAKPKARVIAAVQADQNADGQALYKLLQSAGPKFEFFTIDGQGGGVVKTSQGSIYRFSPQTFNTQSGGPVTGPVTIAIKEIFKPSNMIFAYRPTATGGGQLTSYGEFFVRAIQAGQDLVLAPDSAVKVQVPAKRPAQQEGVPMWGGDTTTLISTTGYNDFNQFITVPTAASSNPGVNWNPAPGFALFDGTNGTLNFPLDSLATWRNCDALSNLPGPKTTVLGFFTNFYNPATSTSYTGEEPSMLFFKPAGVTTLVKLYNVILNPSVPQHQGLLSYQNSLPIGQAGAFLAITALNGQFYAQKLTTTIPTPSSGGFASINFNLVPVTPAALISLIQSMDTP